MHYGTETTIADTVGLTPEQMHRELENLGRDLRRYDGARNVVPPRPRPARWNNRLRQVLVPGKRKAARHPWADRLAAARTGGFAVGQIFTDTSRVTASCFACGERVTIDAATASQTDKFGFEEECRRHEARECIAGDEL